MLGGFYKLGALSACADYGLIKVAALNSVLRIAPAVAEKYVHTKAVRAAQNKIRDAFGLETPEWRRGGGLFDVPVLVAERIGRQIQKTLAPEPAPVVVPVVKLETPKGLEQSQGEKPEQTEI